MARAGSARRRRHDDPEPHQRRPHGIHRQPRPRYFTPHDLTPIGDLVAYVSANFTQLTDSGPKTTTLTLTPGFRTHLGRNWYLLGGVVVPVTNPKPFDYQVQTALMIVF